MHGGVLSLSDGGVFRANVVTSPTYFCGVASNDVPSSRSDTLDAAQLVLALQIPMRAFGTATPTIYFLFCEAPFLPQVGLHHITLRFALVLK